MNAIKVAVAILVAASVFLGGCAGGATKLDPNRPFLEIPPVPADVQRELASKDVQKIPVYISSRVKYYDASKYMELAEKVAKMKPEEKLKVSWVKEFPTILDPPLGSLLVTNAAKVVEFSRTNIAERGFRIVDIPCQECLIVLFDYAEYWKIEPVPIPIFLREQKTLYKFIRARLYYKNNEISVGHSDSVSGLWGNGLITFPGDDLDNNFKGNGKVATDDVFRALTLNIASWRR